MRGRGGRKRIEEGYDFLSCGLLLWIIELGKLYNIYSWASTMRNILPSRPSEFLSKDYWNSFFSKLKSSKHD
jgi:hypothetical protein